MDRTSSGITTCNDGRSRRSQVITGGPTARCVVFDSFSQEDAVFKVEQRPIGEEIRRTAGLEITWKGSNKHHGRGGERRFSSRAGM